LAKFFYLCNMNTLVQHIEKLLLEHDCVIVPGFGGFIANTMPAHYNDAEGLFLPPYRAIIFNQNLTDNDGLLIQAYMQTFDAAYPEALCQLEKDVNKLCLQLDIHGEIQLGDIGLLKKNLENRICLLPQETGIQTPYFYGLSALAVPTISQLLASQAEASAATEKTAEEKKTLSIESQQPVNPEQEERTEEKSKATKRSPLLVDFGIAAAIAAIMFLVFSAPIITTSKTEADYCIAGTLVVKPNVEQAYVATNTTKTESSGNATDKSKNAEATTEAITNTISKTADTTERETTPPQSNLKQQTAAESYTLVLACHVTEKNANLFIQHLTQSGYEGAEFVNGRVTRILYGNYPSEEEAAKNLRKLRKENDNFASAWIMKK